jgi:DNA-binding transcriptional LysR family regulator
MDMRQIEFFVAVAEERNFTRAAELTYVTQSGLSSSIRGLERELGIQLFERGARAVALTAGGQRLLPRARRMLADARAVHRELKLEKDGLTGTLRVGAEQCLGDLVDLPDLLAAFQGRYPAVSLFFEQSGSGQLLDQLARGELDVALVAQPVHGRPSSAARGIRSVELRREPFVVLSAPDHPLAGAGELDWPMLEPHAFVDFAPGWTARGIVDEELEHRRIARRSAATVNDVHILLDLVRRGIGLAMVPRSIAAKPDAEGLARRVLPDPQPEWVVHLVSVGDEGPTRRFAELLVPADDARSLRDDVRSVVGPDVEPGADTVALAGATAIGHGDHERSRS